MDTFKTAEHIKEQWRRLWPVDDSRLPMKRRGVVCPLCGSGSGKHKSGVKETPWHGKHRLKCFRCGFYGDAINLLSRELGIDAHGRGFIAILEEGERRLARSIPLEASAPARKETSKRVDFSAFYETAAAGLDEPQAREFLARRGISLQAAKKCGLGFVARWKHPFGGKAESPRLIFPCGRFDYFARDTRENAPAPKLHIGEKTLFNPLHAPEGGGCVFIVEGGLDAVAIIEEGGAAVALMGTDSRRLIEAAQNADFGGVFALALDNDEAGRKAAAELQERLDAAGFSYGFSPICGRWKDCAEAHKHAPGRFRKML